MAGCGACPSSPGGPASSPATTSRPSSGLVLLTRNKNTRRGEQETRGVRGFLLPADKSLQGLLQHQRGPGTPCPGGMALGSSLSFCCSVGRFGCTHRAGIAAPPRAGRRGREQSGSGGQTVRVGEQRNTSHCLLVLHRGCWHQQLLP